MDSLAYIMINGWKMSPILRIETLDSPELEPFRTLRRPEEHFRQRIFVAEGEKLVIRLLESGLECISILITPEWLERLDGHGFKNRCTTVKVHVAALDLVREIVGFNIHQGIMALGRVPLEGSLDQLPEPHLVLALDGLRSAENVGVIVRNCAAFGADLVIAGETACSPYLRRAVRNSMGAVFRMPVLHSENLAPTLRDLKKKRGTKIVACTPHGADPIFETDLAGCVCIVMGNEDAGLSPEILNLADARAAIPMTAGIDSLNVASASAVFLYEAARRKLEIRGNRAGTFPAVPC